MSATDSLQRFVFARAALRGDRVLLQQSYREILGRYPYPGGVAELLGQALVAVELLAATLKMEGSISLQFQGSTALPLLVAETNHQRQLRGLARWGKCFSSSDFSQLTAGGTLVVNIIPEKGNRYQGIVPLDGPDLAACLGHYFCQSEQLATGIWLAADPAGAGGLLVQKLPASPANDDTLFDEVVMLAETVRSEELISLEHKMLLQRLFSEYDLKLFEQEPIHFHCTCSRQRALNSILMLPNEEIRALMAEQEQICSNCEFCRAQYFFSKQEVYESIIVRSATSTTLQ